MHGSGEFSVTEENDRPGGGPEDSAAGTPGKRPAPATPAAPAFEPSAVPPKPSTPPTSATPVVPLAAPPAKGALGSAGAALAGAGSAASEKASQLASLARRQSPARIGGAVAAVVVMGLLIWWLTSLGGGGSKQPDAAASPAAATAPSAPASRGPLPLEGVGPLDFQLGDCFKDFDPEAPQSTIVDCTAGHSAQLIAIHHYQEPDAYPGLSALKDKGRETCRSAQLTAAATNYELKQRNAYPSSTSWGNGDRRVDCYVTADNGNVIMESLIP